MLLKEALPGYPDKNSTSEPPLSTSSPCFVLLYDTHDIIELFAYHLSPYTGRSSVRTVFFFLFCSLLYP